MKEAGALRRARRDGSALLAIEPLWQLLELLLVEGHLGEGALGALLTEDFLWLIIQIVWLELAQCAVRAVTMLVPRHTLGALVAGHLLLVGQIANDRLWMVWITVFLAVTICIRPSILDLMHAIDASTRVQV